MRIEDIARVPLASLPTPVDNLPRLTALLSGPRLKIKRDDLTGLALGGAKARKMEFLFADALNQGARTILTAGPNQSNHCRLAAAAAARCGLDCVLVLSSKDPAGEAQKTPAVNTFMDQLFGAEIRWVLPEQRDASLPAVFDELVRGGRKPYMFPNTDTHPLSAPGYALAIREMLEQGQYPDWIVFSSSTGGTHAGFMLGKQLFGWRGCILGINASSPSARLRATILKTYGAACQLLGLEPEFSAEDILLDEGYLGEGYAVVNAMDLVAVHLWAQTEGLLLDPVYTGRAAAGLMDLIRKGKFTRDEEVLFWHTGGTPMLFSSPYMGYTLNGLPGG